MDMSSLSMEDLGRLSDLLDELSAVVNDKEDIIKNIALIDVKKMNQALDTKNKANDKASKFTIEDLSMSRNIDEIKTFVTSNLDSSYEMHEIDENAKRLNEELDAISLREEYLKLEIEKLVKINSIDKIQSNGIILDMLNTTIYILDQEIPKSIDKISPDSCRIIDCGKELIKEISNLLLENVSEKEVYTDSSIYENFNKLKDRVNEYEREKNKSDDKQLEMLKRPILPEQEEKVEQPEEEQKEEEKIEESKVEEQVVENSIEEPKVEVSQEEPKVEVPQEEVKPIVLDTTPKVDLEVKEPETQVNIEPSVEEPKIEVPQEEAKPIVLDTTPTLEQPQVQVEVKEEPKIQVDSLESLENLQKEMKGEQPVQSEPVPENIVPLSSFLETPVEPTVVTPSPEVPVQPQEVVTPVQTIPVQPEPAPVAKPEVRTLGIEKGVDPDLVRAARTKKAKLAKIHGNTQGSYDPVKIVKFEDLGKVDTTSESFNLDNFINQPQVKAAA
ncbi:MAG: hypothetical protein J6O62_02435 [Bacilli bacterium]|nr:hypothetical protein [Bacilli bacterium]MBO6195523.1 hypothetical protein [Bacilli bacterium]